MTEPSEMIGLEPEGPECEHDYVFSDVYPMYAHHEINRGKANPFRLYWVCEKCRAHGAVLFRCNHSRYEELVERFTVNYEIDNQWSINQYCEWWMGHRPKRGNVTCAAFELGVMAKIRDDLDGELQRRMHQREMEGVERRIRRDNALRGAKTRQSRVYFIRNPVTGHIKIGVTTNVERRITGLSSQGGIRLEILGVMKGTRDREAEIHRQFEHLRTHGEWFEGSLQLLAWIAQNVPPHRTRKAKKRAVASAA